VAISNPTHSPSRRAPPQKEPSLRCDQPSDFIDSRFSTLICAPVYTSREGLATEVAVGVAEGLKHDSSILCDALVSMPKSALTDFIGSLPSERLSALGAALRIALALET
jgi:mRNA interferase MazF